MTAEEAVPGVHPPPSSWPVALDDIEADALTTERLLAGERADEIAAWAQRFTDWVPQSSLGPLPEDLRERAMHLLQRQLAVAERLVERITQSQRQRDLAARMTYGPSKPVPAYIDRAL